MCIQIVPFESFRIHYTIIGGISYWKENIRI